MAPPPKYQIDLERRVAILEDRDKSRSENRLWQATAVVSLIVLAVGGVAWWVFYVTTNIIAIKQQLSDGGSKQLVSELIKPKSDQQLQANLATISAQVQVARAKGVSPDVNKVKALDTAMVDVVTEHPQLPEVWHAAFQLINYRSELNHVISESSKSCLDGNDYPLEQLRTSLSEPRQFRLPGTTFTFDARDCTLNLDNDSEFKQKTAGRFFRS